MRRQRKPTVPFEGGELSKPKVKGPSIRKQTAKPSRKTSSRDPEISCKGKAIAVPKNLSSRSTDFDESWEAEIVGSSLACYTEKASKQCDPSFQDVLIKGLSKGHGITGFPNRLRSSLEESEEGAQMLRNAMTKLSFTLASPLEESDDLESKPEEAVKASKPGNLSTQKVSKGKGIVHMPSPEPLIRIPSVPTRIHLTLNGRCQTSVDSTNIDLHDMSYEEFVQHLKERLEFAPFRVKQETLEEGEISCTWLWLTAAKYGSQKKALNLNALSRDDHYQCLRLDILATAKKNKALSNMVLRIDMFVGCIGENLGDEDTGRPSATREQRALIEHRKQSDLTVLTKQLRENLLCNHPSHKQPNQYCWKPKKPPFGGNTCVTLAAHDIVDWADAIIANAATLHAPPDREEWWALEAKYRPTERRANAKGAGQSGGLAPNYIFAGGFDPSQLFGAQVSRAEPERGISNPSPIRHFPPEEYNLTGLHAYLSWMKNEFVEDEYLELYQRLSQEKIGIDIFKSVSGSKDARNDLVQELKHDLKIKAGMARRLVDKFLDWHSSLA